MIKHPVDSEPTPSPPDTKSFNDATSVISAHDNGPAAQFARSFGSLMQAFIEIGDRDNVNFNNELAIARHNSDVRRETDPRKSIEALEWAEAIINSAGLSLEVEVADQSYKLVHVDEAETHSARKDRGIKAAYSLTINDGRLFVAFLEAALSTNTEQELQDEDRMKLASTIDIKIVSKYCRRLSRKKPVNEATVEQHLIEFVKYAERIDDAIKPFLEGRDDESDWRVGRLTDYYNSQELLPLLYVMDHGFLDPRWGYCDMSQVFKLVSPRTEPEADEDGFIPECMMGSEQEIAENIETEFMGPLKELAAFGSEIVLCDLVESIESMLKELKDPNGKNRVFHTAWTGDPTRTTRTNLACNLLEMELEQFKKDVF